MADIDRELKEMLLLFDQVSNWTAEFYKDTPDWVSVMDPAHGSQPIKHAKTRLVAILKDREAALLSRIKEAGPENKPTQGGGWRADANGGFNEANEAWNQAIDNIAKEIRGESNGNI